MNCPRLDDSVTSTTSSKWNLYTSRSFGKSTSRVYFIPVFFLLLHAWSRCFAKGVCHLTTRARKSFRPCTKWSPIFFRTSGTDLIAHSRPDGPGNLEKVVGNPRFLSSEPEERKVKVKKKQRDSFSAGRKWFFLGLLRECFVLCLYVVFIKWSLDSFFLLFWWAGTKSKRLTGLCLRAVHSNGNKSSKLQVVV